MPIQSGYPIPFDDAVRTRLEPRARTCEGAERSGEVSFGLPMSEGNNNVQEWALRGDHAARRERVRASE
jgi:hypothetical protein